MLSPVNIVKSLEEVWRVVRDEAALMLMKGDLMVGTMGIINPVWWYSDEGFLTDRWHFVLPDYDDTPDAGLLLDEAIKIAETAGIIFIHQGKARRGKKGILRMRPRIYDGESVNIESGG